MSLQDMRQPVEIQCGAMHMRPHENLFYSALEVKTCYEMLLGEVEVLTKEEDVVGRNGTWSQGTTVFQVKVWSSLYVPVHVPQRPTKETFCSTYLLLSLQFNFCGKMCSLLGCWVLWAIYRQKGTLLSRTDLVMWPRIMWKKMFTGTSWQRVTRGRWSIMNWKVLD